MKNNIVSTVLICTSMFLLTNCSEKNVHDKVNISIPEKTKLKNPVIPSSAAEFQNRFNIKFNLPENSEQIEYSIIAEKLIQMNFVWSCCDCTVRSKKSNKFEDISGCYYDWESTSIEKIKKCEATVKYTTCSDGNIVAICLWFDNENEQMYSFSIILPGIGPGNLDDVRQLAIRMSEQVYNEL